jgi:hypothetical protein
MHCGLPPQATISGESLRYKTSLHWSVLLQFHLIEYHRFAAMRRVEERSLSSILRSGLLTT